SSGVLVLPAQPRLGPLAPAYSRDCGLRSPCHATGGRLTGCGGARRAGGGRPERRGGPPARAPPPGLPAQGDAMPYYRVTGEVPRKRHIRFHRPDGGLYSEELMGEEGFSSDSSLLYHIHLPTAITKSEGVEDGGQAGMVPNHPLLPRHVRTT